MNADQFIEAAADKINREYGYLGDKAKAIARIILPLVREDVRPETDHFADAGKPMPETAEPVALACYDAGLLNDWGGGNVEWWYDYIRAELARAHDFYADQFTHPPQTEVVEALEPFAKAFENLRYTVSGHGKKWDLAPKDEDDCGPTVYCKTERIDGASCGTSTELELVDFMRVANLLKALKGSRP